MAANVSFEGLDTDGKAAMMRLQLQLDKQEAKAYEQQQAQDAQQFVNDGLSQVVNGAQDMLAMVGLPTDAAGLGQTVGALAGISGGPLGMMAGGILGKAGGGIIGGIGKAFGIG